MRDSLLGRTLAAFAAGMLALTIAGPAGASRAEEVLCWDDGGMDSYDHVVTGRPGQKMAVRFQAPEWAVWVTEIHVFIANDLVDNPVNPELPTTKPFVAYVWTPSDGDPVLPGPAANAGVNSGELYPEEAWLQVVLPVAVNISDPVQFPDRVFFVGLQWLHELNPYIGEDHSDPLDYSSWRYNWYEWELRVYADTMIRAVVTDAVSPTANVGWSRVKALFR